MRRLIRLLFLALGAGGGAWLIDAGRRARRTERPLRAVVRADAVDFMTHRFDPMVMRLGLVGGRASVCGVLEHVGRATGTIHRTPVVPQLADGHLFIALPFGAQVEWLQNVRAAGHCLLQLHEMIYDLDEPAVVSPRENPTLPTLIAQPLERMGAEYLRLHVLDRAPGTFAPLVEEAGGVPAVEHEPQIEIVHPGEAEAETEAAPARAKG